MDLLLISGYVIVALFTTGVIYGSLEGVVDDKPNRQYISLVIGIAWPLTFLSTAIVLMGIVVCSMVLDE